MLPKRKMFIPKQILAPKGVLIKKHNDGFAQEIFAKYNVLRNDFAAWFELFYNVDGIYEDYERADIGQLLINVRMQLQIQEESNKSSISILGQQALTNFKKQLESTVKTVYSSAGHQSLKYLKEKLLKSNLPNSMLFGNGFYNKSIKPYHAFHGDLKNEFSLNFNAITAETSFGNTLNFLTRAESSLGNVLSVPAKAGSSLGNVLSVSARAGSSFGSILSFPARAEYGLGNIFSFPTRAEYGLGNVLSFPTRAKSGLGNVLSFPTIAKSSLGNSFSFPTRFEINNNRKAINEYRRAINDFYFKSINPYHAFHGDLKNEFSLNFNAIADTSSLGNIFSFLNRSESSFGNTSDFLTRAGSSLRNIFSFLTRAETSLGSILSFPTRFEINNNRKAINKYRRAINGFYFKSINPYHAFYGDLKNEFSLNFNAITAGSSFENAFNFLTRAETSFGNTFSFPTRAETSFGNVFGFLTGAGSSLRNILSFPTRAEYGLGNVLSFPTIATSSLWNVLNFLTRAETSLGSNLSFQTRFNINKNRKAINKYRRAINDFYFKSINPYHVFHGDLKNEFSLKFNAITATPDLGSVRIPYNSELVIGGKNINSFYFKNMNDNSVIYPIVNINGSRGLYSPIGNYGENYASIINMNPYNFGNYYHIYFPRLSSYIGSGFKMAYIRGESIKEFSSLIHDKIVSGLRHELPEVLRSAYRSGMFGVKRTKRKQKREMDSETKEFWHNMTYNIIQGFRKELESKTSYFFTNYIDKRAYGLSPFLENEDEDEYKESTHGNWTSQETLTHNKHTSFVHLSERERKRITPHSIYNLKKTYPDIYSMLTFAGLLPTLYVQKHSRETAMGLLSNSINHFYLGNRNLTVRAYDLLRNKLETEKNSFIWPEDMNNLTNMEFNNVRKAHRSSRYMEEIQALKTQVVNIEKQTLQSVQYSNVNVNGLVEKVYKEIEHRIKVDRVRRGY